MINNPSPELSQAEYTETPYQDQSWEIVGEFKNNAIFEPLDVPVLGKHALTTDPMFADFGGTGKGGEQRRFHLPEGAEGTPRKKANEEKAKEAERERLHAEAVEKARREGQVQGEAKAKAESTEQARQKEDQLKGRVKEILEQLQRQYAEGLASIEQEAVKLAIAMAGKIIGYAVEINPEYINELVRRALGLAGSASIKRVRVSPADHEFIQIVGLASDVQDATEGIRFERDESIKSGCIVETSAGEVDLRIDEAWERMKENVVKAVK